MRLVLLGPPGAGKGTQGDLLSERLAVPKISTGDLLRKHAEAATPLGILARPHLDGGTLVPDEVTLGVVAERLRDPDAAEGFLLDGSPARCGRRTTSTSCCATPGRRSTG